MSKPFVGQIVEYRYKPDGSTPPLAAIVTQLHGEKDGAHWVALHCFSETSRWIPHVEFGVHCKAAAPPEEGPPEEGKSSSGMFGYHPGVFP